ncbi:MAG: M48 family metallopeptidase [Cocleimonas sp.]|nr:M48 family metallopeptidase [Cocleimonas sp.]
MSETHWLQLPDQQRHPYKLVKSKRAKYVRIKVSTSGEVSVVLPQGIAAKHAHGFIQKKSEWIAKTIKAMPEEENNSFPETLDLKLLDELWSINYKHTPPLLHDIKLKQISSNTLDIRVATDGWADIKKLLNKWLRLKAKKVFPEMLESLAEEHGFHFNKISIRSQKTRWGSCASNKNISLNSKLLLMPENVVKYVMIHELCHTIEMNHSTKFWDLVEDCDPQYRDNRKQLKMLGKLISL